MVSMIDKRKGLLQELWRKAYEGSQPVIIKLKSRAEANRIRFDLYGSVRDVKTNPRLDPKLSEAAIGCIISFRDEKTLQISRRTIEDALMEAAEAYGIDQTEAKPAPATEAEAEFRAATAGGMMERMRKVQEETDRKQREAEAASLDPHAGGMPIPYTMPEGKEFSASVPEPKLDIKALGIRYGYRGPR